MGSRRCGSLEVAVWPSSSWTRVTHPGSCRPDTQSWGLPSKHSTHFVRVGYQVDSMAGLLVAVRSSCFHSRSTRSAPPVRERTRGDRLRKRLRADWDRAGVSRSRRRITERGRRRLRQTKLLSPRGRNPLAETVRDKISRCAELNASTESRWTLTSFALLRPVASIADVTCTDSARRVRPALRTGPKPPEWPAIGTIPQSTPSQPPHH